MKEIADLLPEKYKTSGKITVGSTTGLAPMMFIGNDGKTITGVEADLMHAVGQVLGVKVDLKDVKPEAFMTGLLAQRFDAAAGSITYTKERKAQADFVVYAHYGQALAKAADNQENITFDTLCGKTVAVLNGSVQQTKFLPQLSDKCVGAGNAAIKGDAFPDANSLFLAVQSNRADAAFLNEVSVLYQVDQSKGKMQLADTGLGSDPKGIVIGRDTGLQKALTAAVKHLNDTGKMKEIFAKWGLEKILTGDVQLNPAEV
ncbi:transporter substrate-binding domain-containing protein [Arthrobacter sp. UYEF3]|uniref:transporter substrate-binding domain-containing protein n=1 Tax=Arthrobacter sp. UYEF3 TaxID=1756365 RepID=UPI003392D484